LLTVTCCFFACKKNNRDSNTGSTTGNGKTYPITFNLNPASGNSLASGPLDTAFTNNVKTIAYVLYDSNGKLVSQILQDATFSNFGTISTSAPAGTYYAYFMGNANYRFDASTPYFYPTLPSQGLHTIFNDVFYRKDTLVVGNTAVNQNIVMGRTTARLVLDIQDSVPKIAGSIGIYSRSTLAYSMLDTSYVQQSNFIPEFYHNFTAAEKGKTDVKISMIIYNPHVLQTIRLIVYGPGVPPGDPIIINNVKFIRNHTTTLTGKVFKNTINTNNTFKVSIDTTWNDSTINF